MPPRRHHSSVIDPFARDATPRHVALHLLGRSAGFATGRASTLNPREADLCALLARHEQGVHSDRLLLELSGDGGRPGTLKALLFRTRSIVPIAGPPYRLHDTVATDVATVRRDLARGATATALMRYRGPLLPRSMAPGVIEFREEVEEAVRQAALATNDPWPLRHVSDVISDDLELAEHALLACAANESAYPRLLARVRRLERAYGVVKQLAEGGEQADRSGA